MTKEARKPNSEIRRNPEFRNPKTGACLDAWMDADSCGSRAKCRGCSEGGALPGFHRTLLFGFPSPFRIRSSGFLLISSFFRHLALVIRHFSALHRFVSLSTSRATRCVHIRIVGINIPATPAAEDAVVAG